MKHKKPSEVKIIQVLITPNDAMNQGELIGLGDNGATYMSKTAGNETHWFQIIAK